MKTVELRTLLSASKAVHMSQPAMTQAIARLETQIDAELFRRQSDGMAPTELATLLYPRIVAALELIRSTRITNAQARAFVALAKEGSYSQASRTTGLAQASLHRAVSDLEHVLGQKLVSRRGRGLEITPQGKAVARRLSLAHAEIAAGLQEAEILKGKTAGRIAIGAMPLCRARLLPNAVVEFQTESPNSDIIVVEGSHAELIEPLRDGDLDIMIGALRDPVPGHDLIQEPLFEDKPSIIARADHPLAHQATRGEISVEDLTKYKWCVPKRGIPLRDRWQAMFDAAGVQAPTVSVECGSVIAIRQILLKTDCLTILSPDQIAVELEANWLAVIGGAPASLKRTIGFTCRNGWRPTSAQERFLNVMRRIS